MTSVTEILKLIFAVDYASIPYHVLETARIRGTELHSAIENHYDNVEQIIPLEYMQWWDKFIEWDNDNEVEILEKEKTLVSEELGIKGRFDCLMMLNGEEYLVDYKFTANLNKKYVELQLTMYLMLLGIDRDITNIKIGVLHITKNKAKFVELTPRYDEVNALIKLYKYMEVVV